MFLSFVGHHIGNIEMLTVDQRRVFSQEGVLRLDGAVPANAVSRMCDRLWEFMELKHGLRRKDPSSWSPGARPSGFQSLVRSNAFSEMASDRLCTAVDELLDRPDISKTPKHWGIPLPAFPQLGKWALPGGPDTWHIDVAARGTRCWALRAFLLLDYVQEHGGPAIVVAGSARVTRRIASDVGSKDPTGLRSKQARTTLMKTEPWIRQLLTDPTRRNPIAPEAIATDGTPLRIVPLTGNPGDVFLMDLGSLHSKSANTAKTPRLMISQTFYTNSE